MVTSLICSGQPQVLPGHWAYEEAGGEVEIKNPDGSARETRKIIVNNSRYAVDSMEEGEVRIRA